MIRYIKPLRMIAISRKHEYVGTYMTKAPANQLGRFARGRRCPSAAILNFSKFIAIFQSNIEPLPKEYRSVEFPGF